MSEHRGDRNMDRFDFELQQYQALRSEIVRSMEDGNQIMGFGLAAIGLVLNAGFGVQGTLQGFIVFAVILPGMSSLVLSMWFSAQERTARASHFISGFESRLKATLCIEDDAMWETWLRSESTSRTSNRSATHHFWHTESGGIGLLCLLIFFSLVFSLKAGGTEVHAALKYTTVCVTLTYVVLFLCTMTQRYKNWRKWLLTVPSDSSERTSERV